MNEHLNEHLSDSQLDDLLRRDGLEAVADEGFTARLMPRLPPRRRRRALGLPLAAVLGALLTWGALLPSSLLQGAAREWAAGELGASLGLVYLGLLGVGLLSCAWALEEAE